MPEQHQQTNLHYHNESNKTVKEEVKEQPKEESKPIEKAPVETTTPPSQDNSVVEVPETPIVEEIPKEIQIDESTKSQKSVESKLDNLGSTQQEIQIAIKKLII